MAVVLNVAPHADPFRGNYRNQGAAFNPSGLATERLDRQAESTANTCYGSARENHCA